jgi:hypothetical protein
LYYNYLRQKDLLFFFNNKQFNSEESINILIQNNKFHLISKILNKKVFKVNLNNSIYVSLSNSIITNLGLLFLNFSSFKDITVNSLVTFKNILFLKLYNNLYLTPQFKEMKSFSYAYNLKTYLFTLKLIQSIFSNTIKTICCLKS